MNTVKITSDNFEQEVLKSDKPEIGRASCRERVFSSV